MPSGRERFLRLQLQELTTRVDDCGPPQNLYQIEFDQLKDHDVLRIGTTDNCYQVRVLSACSRIVLVLGGPFKGWTLATLEGAVERFSLCQDPVICMGRRVIFRNRVNTIITGPVTSLVCCR